MSIRCWHCKSSHETTAEVRACAGLAPAAPRIRKIEAPGEKTPEIKISDGMYKLGDTIWKVQIAVHGSGRLYGKKLDVVERRDGTKKASWEVIPGAVRILTNRHAKPLTLEEAQEFGKLYGFCVKCGRTLTDETSIEAGIGPICAASMA